MKIKTLISFCILLLGAACNARAFPAPQPTAVPTAPEILASPTVASLSQSLSLASESFNESGSAPVYAIAAQIPYLQGSTDPRVETFNARLKQVAETDIDVFRKDILANQPPTPIVAGSSYDLRYQQIGQRGEVWSVKFDVMIFVDGAAHPGHYSITVNYDLGQGRELALDDLFLPNSNYLQVIADYCKAELSKRDIGFQDVMFNSGADPKPENYQRWNISNDGLIVTFDEYQVAAYAAGPQTVTVPFSALQSVINPQGALTLFQ